MSNFFVLLPGTQGPKLMLIIRSRVTVRGWLTTRRIGRLVVVGRVGIIIARWVVSTCRAVAIRTRRLIRGLIRRGWRLIRSGILVTCLIGGCTIRTTVSRCVSWTQMIITAIPIITSGEWSCRCGIFRGRRWRYRWDCCYRRSII